MLCFLEARIDMRPEWAPLVPGSNVERAEYRFIAGSLLELRDKIDDGKNETLMLTPIGVEALKRVLKG